MPSNKMRASTYYQNIQQALFQLKDRHGSSLAAIKKAVMQLRGEDYHNNHFLARLKTAIADGRVEKVGQLYKLEADEKKIAKKMYEEPKPKTPKLKSRR